ncbi:LamG domain-containing protein [Blautia massiliensis (ex Durand et al. 2017)]|uniref:LamG domain-containing protein n=1 Tax=Blautia massiliensis (ex Durand et al. 2017) TaxID=1737424 RepID=UPI0015709571|nr:LamG domain-containing protein [Blautia massiliensis (ex Durand et al. 2017)]NSK75178.1 LamG domain-containing protein [Blautia massiliensis (ex Durand et al. 2017)]
MGLQVWMPMIGNINNQGLSNLSNLSGKYVQGTCSTFGKCLNVPNSSLISFTADGLVNAKKFSVCFWTLADKSTKTDWNQMLKLGDKKTDGSYGSNFRFESCTTYPRACSFHNNDKNAITAGSRILGSSNSTWYHVCVTYDGTELKSYTNGNLIGTDVGNGGYLTGYVQIGSANYFGLMNDLRIYDEVISQKQIRSIYNLQIIHYPLNNIYEVGITNKYFGDAAEGALNYDGNYITRTKLSNERGYKYKLSYTGTGKDMWKSLEIGSHFSFTAGRTHYYSCKVRCHSKSHTQLFLRAARCDNDWVTNMVDTLNADGQWHEYTVSQTINANFDRSGTTVTCNPWVEFYTNDMSTNGMSYTFDVDIKDIQVTEGQKYSFIANEMVTSSVLDISGYSNNASVDVGIGIGVQSPRYDACYYFSAKSYLKFPNPIYAKKTIWGLTINMWVRLDSGCGGYATILSGLNNPPSNFPWICVNTEGSGLWSYIWSNAPQYGRGMSNELLSLNTWYMITYVFNSGSVYWYLNGTRKGDITKYTTLNYINADMEYLALGNSYSGTQWNTNFCGWISDFRMFTTVLSADDVKALYQNSASITSTGQVMLAGEVVES